MKESEGMIYFIYLFFCLNGYFKTNHKLTEEIFQPVSKIELFVIFWVEETLGDM